MKKILALVLALAMLMTASSVLATSTDAVGGMEAGWWKGVEIAPSTEFYVDGGKTITMLGIHYNQYPTEFDGGYYLPERGRRCGRSYEQLGFRGRPHLRHPHHRERARLPVHDLP